MSIDEVKAVIGKYTIITVLFFIVFGMLYLIYLFFSWMFGKKDSKTKVGLTIAFIVIVVMISLYLRTAYDSWSWPYNSESFIVSRIMEAEHCSRDQAVIYYQNYLQYKDTATVNNDDNNDEYDE